MQALFANGTAGIMRSACTVLSRLLFTLPTLQDHGKLLIHPKPSTMTPQENNVAADKRMTWMRPRPPVLLRWCCRARLTQVRNRTCRPAGSRPLYRDGRTRTRLAHSGSSTTWHACVRPAATCALAACCSKALLSKTDSCVGFRLRMCITTSKHLTHVQLSIQQADSHKRHLRADDLVLTDALAPARIVEAALPRLRGCSA